ncbi:protein FAM228A [Sardina pilchardus]|uniref:protein FAM228A n=1 Tax=Sardina pilchardus TaxID=27697 RepID=UPI002E0E7B1A
MLLISSLETLTTKPSRVERDTCSWDGFCFIIRQLNETAAMPLKEKNMGVITVHKKVTPACLIRSKSPVSIKREPLVSGSEGRSVPYFKGKCLNTTAKSCRAGPTAWISYNSLRKQLEVEQQDLKAIAQPLLDTESTFVKQEVEQRLRGHQTRDQCRRELLLKRWTEEVWTPIQRGVEQHMTQEHTHHTPHTHTHRLRSMLLHYIHHCNAKVRTHTTHTTHTTPTGSGACCCTTSTTATPRCARANMVEGINLSLCQCMLMSCPVSPQGYVFLDTYDPQEYDPFLLDSIHAYTSKVTTPVLKDPLFIQSRDRMKEKRVVLRCQTGQVYTRTQVEETLRRSLHPPPRCRSHEPRLQRPSLGIPPQSDHSPWRPNRGKNVLYGTADDARCYERQCWSTTRH